MCQHNVKGCQLAKPAPLPGEVGEAASRLDRSLGYGRYAHVTASDIHTILTALSDLQAQLATLEAGVGVRQYREAVERLHKAEAERDGYKARCEGLEWLVEVQEFYIKCNVRMRALVELADTYKAALAATEVEA